MPLYPQRPHDPFCYPPPENFLARPAFDAACGVEENMPVGLVSAESSRQVCTAAKQEFLARPVSNYQIREHS